MTRTNTSPGLIDPIRNRLRRRMFHLISFYFILFRQLFITGQQGGNEQLSHSFFYILFEHTFIEDYPSHDKLI